MGTLGLEWSAWAARKIRTPRQFDLAVLSVIQTAIATVFPEEGSGEAVAALTEIAWHVDQADGKLAIQDAAARLDLAGEVLTEIELFVVFNPRGPIPPPPVFPLPPWLQWPPPKKGTGTGTTSTAQVELEVGRADNPNPVPWDRKTVSVNAVAVLDTLFALADGLIDQAAARRTNEVLRKLQAA